MFKKNVYILKLTRFIQNNMPIGKFSKKNHTVKCDKPSSNKMVKNNLLFKTQNFITTKDKNVFSILRKQRFFTKNKYSRTRQYCKNIVYVGLLINIILMYSLNSIFYGITLNFYKTVLLVTFIVIILVVSLMFKFKTIRTVKYIYNYITSK